MRPKEQFAKYGRPPLGNNIPPFADTVNVTAVLIYPLSAGWSHNPSGFRHGRASDSRGVLVGSDQPASVTLLAGNLRNRRFRYCRLGAAGGLLR